MVFGCPLPDQQIALPPFGGLIRPHSAEAICGQFVVVAHQKRKLRERRFERSERKRNPLDQTQNRSIEAEIEMLHRPAPQVSESRLLRSLFKHCALFNQNKRRYNAPRREPSPDRDQVPPIESRSADRPEIASHRGVSP